MQHAAVPGLKSKPAHVQIALCIAVFLVPFMGSSLNLALPQIGGDFAMSAFGLTFVISMYLLAAAMFQMPAARLSDLFGKRKLFLIGLGLSGLFTFLSGLAWSGTSLVVFRFISGFGSSFVFATNNAILTSVFPKEQRGKALGINTAVVYFAVAVGPYFGGLLAHHLGWRWIFFIAAGLSLAALLAGRAVIRDEWTEAKGEPFDMTGSAAYIVMLGALIMGFSFLPKAAGWGLLALAAAALLIFVRVERRHAYPMLRLEIFAENRHFRLSSLSAMINYSASFASGFLLSLYLQFVLGLNPDKAGLVLMTQPVIQCVLSPIVGRLSDRVNPSLLTTAGMGLLTAALFLFSWVTKETPLAHTVAILSMAGVGYALFSSPNVNIIMGSVSRKLSSLASATTGTARQIGQSLSMAITSLIIHHYMGRHELTAETAGLFPPAMRTGFLIFTAICLVGIYTSASKLFGKDNDEDWRHVSGRFDKKE